MADVDVRIRRAEGLKDYLACVELQRTVWGYTEMEDFAAQPMLMIGNRFGGCVLLAFDQHNRHVGFSFAMPAWKQDRKPFWWSHMTAVIGEYRNRDVGLALKLRQREEALASGIELIEWTFDPLQAMNAHFNISKLGVTVREYEENVYGMTSSPLHAGLPTDRFVAEWHLESETVRHRLGTADRAVIFRDIDNLPRINHDLSCNESPLLLEIPGDITWLKLNKVEEARAWQDEVRKACTHYFSRGYRITDFIRLKGQNGRALYVLEMEGNRP